MAVDPISARAGRLGSALHGEQGDQLVGWPLADWGSLEVRLALAPNHLIRRVGAAGLLLVLAVLCVGCCCSWVPMFCDAWPFADAWVDADCDGQRDEGEEPLEGVCIWSPESPNGPPYDREHCTWDHGRTNEEGRWQGGLISGCNSPYYIVALAPRGFDPTTDTVVGQTIAEFGFAPEGSCPPLPITTPEELALRGRNRLPMWGVGVAAAILLLALGYRKHRRETLARDRASSGD